MDTPRVGIGEMYLLTYEYGKALNGGHAFDLCQESLTPTLEEK